jgi:hypothetical protein
MWLLQTWTVDFACIPTMSVATAMYNEGTPGDQLRPKTFDESALASTFRCVGGMMMAGLSTG